MGLLYINWVRREPSTLPGETRQCMSWSQWHLGLVQMFSLFKETRKREPHIIYWNTSHTNIDLHLTFIGKIPNCTNNKIILTFHFQHNLKLWFLLIEHRFKPLAEWRTISLYAFHRQDYWLAINPHAFPNQSKLIRRRHGFEMYIK